MLLFHVPCILPSSLNPVMLVSMQHGAQFEIDFSLEDGNVFHDVV
jgi:hypothetical protein